MVYVYSLNIYYKLRLFLNYLFGKKIYYYPKYENKNTIKFLSSREYTYIIKQSRKSVFDYFDQHYLKNKLINKKIYNYILKYYDYSFSSFYVFVESIKKNNKFITSNKIFAEQTLKNIYFKKKNKISILNIFFYLIIFCKFIILFIKTFLICLTTPSKNRIKHPDILYLRKKNYPDFVYLTLNNYSNLNKLNMSCIVINFSKSNNKNYFPHLNNLKLSSFLCLKSFFFTTYEFFKFFIIFIKLGMSPTFFYEYLYSSYISLIISYSKSKIITGILLDKAIFSLLYNYKKEKIVCSLNEAFMFEPFRYFDYCDLDIYFHMNEIDKKSINNYGGDIKKYIQVPFFRKNLVKNKNEGISNDLKECINEYDKVILFAPSKINKKQFKPISLELVEKTILVLNEIISKNKNILVIIKEKKGELEYINHNLKLLIDNSKNFYKISSEKPKLLKFNQFEEVIPECNLLLTLTSTSTTVLQSLDKNIPFICINEDHPKSFYKQYENCEVDLKNINEAINYWLSKNSDELKIILSKIKKDLNISEKNGLRDVAYFLKNLLNDKL